MKKMYILLVLPFLFANNMMAQQIADSSLLLLAKSYGAVRYFYPAPNVQENTKGWNNFLLLTLEKLDYNTHQQTTNDILQNGFRDCGFDFTLLNDKPATQDTFTGKGEKGYYWQYSISKNQTEATTLYKAERLRINADYMARLNDATDTTMFVAMDKGNWLKYPFNPAAPIVLNTEKLDTTFNKYQPMASIIELWAELNHFSPLEPNGGWDSLLVSSLHRLSLGKEKAFPLQYMLTQLNDGRASIIDTFKTKKTGKYCIDYVVAEGKVVVETYDTNTIKKNITGYDLYYLNNGYTKFRLDERRDISPSATWDAKDVGALRKLTEGATGTTAYIILHDPKDNKDFRLSLPYDNFWETHSMPRRATDSSLMAANNMAYVDMQTADDKAIKSGLGDKNIQAVVFDLRHCDKLSVDLMHLLPHEEMMAPYKILPTVKYPDRADMIFDTISETIRAKRGGEDKILIFLADATTTGEAEWLLSIVKQTHLGYIIGSKTAGAAGMATQFAMYNTIGQPIDIAFTAVTYLTPGKDKLTGSSIAPNIAVARTQNQIQQNKDEVLLKAVEFVQAKKKFSNK